MVQGRILVVNADDFGLTEGVNRGVIRAHEEGIVTSASLMVRGEAASTAATYGRANLRLGMGLHVDLCEWAYRDGEWVLLYKVVDFTDQEAVAAEVERQLEVFRTLMRRNPTHLDSHQHMHLTEPIKSLLVQMAAELGVPLRLLTPGVSYLGSFYGQSGKGERMPELVSAEALVEIVRALQPGVTELGCHPGLDAELDSVYRDERIAEVAALCDPRVREAIREEGIILCNFAEASRYLTGPKASG